MKFKYLYSASLIFILLAANVAQASDVNKGRDIYKQHCAMCHGNNGTASMAGAADFKRGQGLMQSDHALLERIEKGKNACPAYRGILNQQQILDVVAYIRTLF